MKRILCAFVLMSSHVWADTAPVEVEKNLVSAKQKGVATASLFGKVLYDAELWTQKGARFSMSEEFALTLRYKTGFSATKLVWGTIHEMARMENQSKGNFDSLKPKLNACFADVSVGDRFTGISKSKDRVDFFFNGTKKCTLTYPNITERFFGIWLGPKARDGKSSRQLKG